MLKRKIGILLLIACLVLASIPITLGSNPTSQVVYVARDGSGDFNCDGKADQVEINAALKFVVENPSYTTVHLKGPATYTITDSILVGKNTIFEGDSSAVVKLIDNAQAVGDWPINKPLIGQISKTSSDIGTLIIRGFEIDGNHDNNHDGEYGVPRGKGYYNHIMIWYDNIEVYDMYMHDGHGDGLTVFYSKSVKYHDNRIYLLGHDGLFVMKSENVEAYNNRITCRTNSALRAWNTNHVKFHDNNIDGISGSGGPGIQIQKGLTDISYPMNDIEIYNNTIHTTLGPGIWLYASGGPYPINDAKDVHIHHNIFYNAGTNPNRDWVGGIVTSGFYDTLIENNVFDSNYHAAVAIMAPSSLPTDTGYKVNLHNNIITNTRLRKYQPSGTGYGLINYLPETHTFISDYNDMYNNEVGDYKNAKSTTDIHADPLFADQKNHDYHLKSLAGRWNGNTWVKDSVNSPCIDAGYPNSDYSKEPEDNGNRINIGRYGNTVYASLSGGALPVESAPVMSPIGDRSVNEGDTLSFTVKAEDSDGDLLTYSASNMPSGTHLNSGTGFFTWTPEEGQSGTYNVEFTVSDGKFTDSESITITVVKAGNVVPPVSLVHDNRLREASPDTVFADVTYMDVGGRDGVGSYRDVMWFDLSEYEETDKVEKATLSLFWYYPEDMVRNQDTIVEIYRPEKWDPNSVTWNNKDASTPWKNPGGDWFDLNGQTQGSVPYATITIDGNQVPDNQYYELDVTELVKEYLSGELENTGFLIKARTESDNYVAFYSSDGENEDQRPELDINIEPAGNIYPANVSDNRLREASPDTVFADVTYMDVGGRDGVGSYRDVMWFDLSEYEETDKVEKATLSLFWYYPEDMVRNQDTIVEIYRPEKWDPNSVTWNNKDASTPWKNPGGDWFDLNGQTQGSVPYATITIDGNQVPDNQYYELDVTELVKEYLRGEFENTGFLIKARTESNNYVAFYSSDGENEDQRPKLVVTKKATLTSPVDNRLREASRDSFFADTPYLDIGGIPGVGRYRDIIKFNLSEYEGTETIEKATLSLFWYYPEDKVRRQDTIVEVYRPEKWDPNSVTWNNRDSETPWQNPGGDWFDLNGETQGSVPYTTSKIDQNKVPDNQYYELEVTELVQEYVNGEYENTGFLLKACVENDNYIAFYSGEWGDENQRPKLEIVYS